MTQDKSAAEIEREIEAERAGLARSLEELQAQFSPEQMVNTATTYMREHGGDIAATVGRQIKGNPMAAGLVGVGLAWLMAGGTQPSRVPPRRRLPAPDPALRRSEYVGGVDDIPAHEPRLAYDDRSYPSAPGHLSDPMDGFDARVARADGYDEEGTWDGFKREGLSRWGEFRESTSEAFRNWQAGSDRDDNGPSALDSARLQAKGLARRVYSRAADLKARLTEGTDDMDETSRLRVMRARQSAYEAQAAMEERFGTYAASGRRAVSDNPLIGGALALAAGALVGALLPRTERENQMFGAYRDQAFDEADRVFREESTKLRAVAEAAVDEAKTMGKEVVSEAKSSLSGAKADIPSGEEAVARAEGGVRDAVARVANAAKTEAEKRDLGGELKS